MSCTHCGSQKANGICQGCKSAKYCSSKCQEDHWIKIHSQECLIGGQEEQDEQDKSAYKIFLSVFANNEAFLTALLDKLTPAQILNYNLVDKGFRKAVAQNNYFWFLYMQKNQPFRLLIIHANEKKSNDVTIEGMIPGIDYQKWAIQFKDDIKIDEDGQTNGGTPRIQSERCRFYPKSYTHQGIMVMVSDWWKDEMYWIREDDDFTWSVSAQPSHTTLVEENSENLNFDLFSVPPESKTLNLTMNEDLRW